FRRTLEDAVRALADIFRRDHRHLGIVEWEEEDEIALLIPLRAPSEVDEVVVVAGRIEERAGHVALAEERIRLGFRIEMGHLVAALEGRHAVVAERDRIARILEGGPDDVFESGLLCGIRHDAGLLYLLR